MENRKISFVSEKLSWWTALYENVPITSHLLLCNIGDLIYRLLRLVQKYFFTKSITKHDEFKNDIKSF